MACDRDEGGVWAGVSDWLTALLPRLRRALGTARLSLTDLVGQDERVRAYARDRAYRFGHGLIDCLAAWHERSAAPPWLLLCDDDDNAGALVQRLLRDLVRRRGQALGLELWLAVEPQGGPVALAPFAPLAECVLETHVLSAAERVAPAPEVAARAARELEQATQGDPLETEVALAPDNPTLLRHHEQARDARDRATLPPGP